MKRILALVLISCMVLSFASCASTQLEVPKETGEQTQTGSSGEGTNDPASSSGKKDGPITLPEGFSVGYARKDMSPKIPVLTYEGAVTNTIHDPVQITCISISDGEETALFYSLDLRQSFSAIVEPSMRMVEKKFGHLGIGQDSMFFTATHNHSSPDAGTETASGMQAWYTLYYQKLNEVTEESLRDLTPAEAFVGKGNTKDISFVRRYITSDGRVTTDSTQNVVGYESQPDTELRTMRFDRGEKKDVLMVNYQTHYGVATKYFGHVVSADFIHDFRQAAEKELDVHFAYYQGAAGCTVFSALKGDRVYNTYMDSIPAFMTTVREALNGETKVQTGKIQKESSLYEGTVRKDDAATVALASAIYNEKDPVKKQQLLANQSTFVNASAAESCVYRNLNKSIGEKISMRFSAISFGEIGFAGAPYEMFHQNGIQLREKSPFKMTFVCGYTNGSHGYVPAWECTVSGSQYDVSGCYENYVSRVVDGSGEEFRDELLRLLNACKEK